MNGQNYSKLKSPPEVHDLKDQLRKANFANRELNMQIKRLEKKFSIEQSKTARVVDHCNKFIGDYLSILSLGRDDENQTIPAVKIDPATPTREWESRLEVAQITLNLISAKDMKSRMKDTTAMAAEQRSPSTFVEAETQWTVDSDDQFDDDVVLKHAVEVEEMLEADEIAHEEYVITSTAPRSPQAANVTVKRGDICYLP